MQKGLFNKFLALVLIFAMLFAGIGEFSSVAAQNAVPVSEKLSLDVQAALLESDGFIDVMVLFKEEPMMRASSLVDESVDTGEAISVRERRALIGELQQSALMSQDAITEWLDAEKLAGNVAEYESFFIVNSLYLSAKADIIEMLATFESVERIEMNEKIYMEKPIPVPTLRMALDPRASEIEKNIKQINANDAWKKGFTGEGVVVGIMDSAVYATHPALKTKFRGYNPETGDMNYKDNYYDAIDGLEKPGAYTDVSHGTHVMGIILGSETNQGGTINHIGVAPDAKWISARVFGDNGESTTNGFLKAAQWMLAPNGDAQKAPHIINNSWGTGYNNKDVFFEMAVQKWKSAGIFPVFASGNKLPGESDPGPKSIASPSNYKDSFAVGAVDERGKLASFSKRGPSPLPGVTGFKPEISAPGVRIRSAAKGGYVYMSGTSMAAPHVAGVAALVKQANPKLSVDGIADVLKNSATEATDATYKTCPNHGYGYGIVNALAAVNEVTGDGSGKIKGTVKDASGSPVFATVTVSQTERSVQSSESTGEFSLSHPVGNWTVEARAYGYKPATFEVNLAKDAEEVLEFKMEKLPTSKLTVIVRNDEGKVVEGAYVRLLQDAALGINDTDEDGSVVIDKVIRSDNEYTLRVFKEGYELVERQVKISGEEERIEISLEKSKNDREKELVKYDNGKLNPKVDHSIKIGGDGYPAVAVQFVPKKAGARIESASIYFYAETWINSGKKAKISVMAKDERGRTITLLEPVEFSIVPGSFNTFSFEKYNLHTDNPYYVVVQSANADSLVVGMDQTGDSNFSYIYSSKNFVPVKSEIVFGALMMRSVISYPADANTIIRKINPPHIDVVNAAGRKITGTAEPHQSVEIVIGELRLDTIATDTGAFEVIISRSLKPCEEIVAYAKDGDGIPSEAVRTYVVTDKAKLEETVKYIGDFITDMPEDASQDLATELFNKHGEAKALLDEINTYEKSPSDSFEKSVIKQNQSRIDSMIRELRDLFIKISPWKARLAAAIEAAEKLLDETWIASSGRDVPTTRKWVKSAQWNNYNAHLLRAKGIYEKTTATEAQMEQAIKDLENGKKLFESTMALGKEYTVVIDEKYPNGSYEGEGRTDGLGLLANHVVITLKDGKLIDARVTEWQHDEKIIKAIEEDGFITRIVDGNRLDVKRTKGYESYCRSIVKAIIQALEKSLNPGTPTDVDKTPLLNKIAEAEAELAKYKISVNGKDVPAGEKWTTSEAHNELAKAIADAKSESEKIDLTTDLRNKAILLLETAKRNFLSALNTGVIEGGETQEYADGEYFASENGNNLQEANKFKIVIENGKIKSVEIVHWADTKGYDKKVAPLIKAIVDNNSTDVDTISHATNSSNSVKRAVKRALAEASAGAVGATEESKAELAKLISQIKELMYEKRAALSESASKQQKQSMIGQVKVAMALLNSEKSSEVGVKVQIETLKIVVEALNSFK